jgi:glucose 1-dehydrogenase
MRLAEKVALVTGAGQGIGRAIAVRFAQEGATVVVEDLHDDEDSRETLRLIREAGAHGNVVAGDMGSVADARRVIDESVDAFGRLDVLVNNAGVERFAPFLEATEADYDIVLGVNLKGPFFAAQAFARKARDAGRAGRIINISSVHEELPFPNFASYCASKGGLKMLTRNLAVELGPLGITVNNIAPGAIETPINSDVLGSPELSRNLVSNIPLGRIGVPGDVATVAVFLASDEAAYITGSTIVVDGGLLWDYSENRGKAG